MADTKNIIIVGKIGSGKSTLANVLSGTEVFKEDSSSVAEIWRAKSKEFEVDLQEENSEKMRCRVIDSVGLGNSKLTKEELLEKFEEEIGTYIDEGISQIFLVIGKKLDREVLTEFSWLNEYLFGKKIFDYTTIVRTNFPDFRSKEKREKDIGDLVNFFGNNKEGYEEIITKIFKKEKIIHVDNPPMSSNKKLRQKSREKLLDHLKNLRDGFPYKSETIKWLDENYPFENERKEMLVLDVSKQNLEGRLNLKGFTNLKRLNCSDNQLTNLDLSDCLNLVELKCNNNRLTNLNFLKSVVNLEKLEIQNNQKLSSQSLKVLESLDKLGELDMNNTNLVEGWGCLLKNCRKLYCNSKEITKELDKKNCSDNERDGKKHYNLDKWREINKQNNLTAEVIPLERLFVIRSNLKKFVDKWGVKEKENNNDQGRIRKYLTYVVRPLTWSYNKISKLWKGNERVLSDLSKLKHPDEFGTQWWLVTGLQWTNRATTVVGGSLVFIGQSDTTDPNSQVYTQTGGVIAIISPFIETIISYANDKIYENKQKKWDEFVADTKNMLESYHELLGILEKIEISKLGEVNKVLKRLDEVADSFLESHDIDNNETVSVFEIIEEKNRKKLAEDLSKKDDEEENSQLSNIIKAIKEVEDEVTKYRQGETDQENVEIKSKIKRKTAKQRDATIAVDELEKSSENDQLTVQTEVSPKGSK